MEPYVEVPQNGRSVVDGNATVEDETKIRSSRKAPICEEEDTSTPSLRHSQPIVIHKHQYIYQGPVVKTKGKNAQISIGSNKGEMQIKHAFDGEDEPLLSDQDYEDEIQQRVPVEVHDTIPHPNVEQGNNDNKNDKYINYNDVNRGEVFDSANDENEKDGGHENNETSLKSDKVRGNSSDERKIETDKSATKQLSGTDRKEKSTEKILKRGMSESHESLFNIEDVKAKFNNMDEYKLMIEYALDGSLTYLLKNMEPMSIHTRFTERHMFDFIPLRNITEEKNKTDKSREIVRLVRQTGEGNYNKFKKCLRDTKQNGCLRKILKVQNEYLAKINQQCTERSRRDSALSQSDSDIYSTINSQTLDDDTFISDIPEHTEQSGTNIPEHTEQAGTGVVPILPSQEAKSPCKAGPTIVPAPSDSLEDIQQNDQTESKPKANLSEVEDKSKKNLDELSTILMVGSDWNSGEREQRFKTCVEMCKEINDKMPELASKIFLPLQPVKVLPNTVIYRNTPQGFQAYRSSGDDNSCLYQSVSLLLSGTENLQFSLRLMTAIHAVSSFKMYKKQMLGHNNDAKYWKMFFMQHMNDQLITEIQTFENAETIIDVCLKVLIMETALLGKDSSVLHVGFLCEALGINILQHFQHKTQYGDISEEVPWIKHLLGESIDVTRPDLHIFWVNHAGIVNGRLDHIVPLLKIPEDTS
ncbi:uncharacterized protein LOC132743273 [Ruditapes philippinarum]|uniref:uncharacterized protein LOC132743273 n=1 Tax=Ruditapes philippinarum TaxID=129788 RepID=UPI00295B10CE|nr:uncharacterized protein LOC132743273 [Ruditapes philippinarum]